LIKIGTGNKSLHFRLDRAKHKAVIYQKGTKLYDFDVETTPDDRVNIIKVRHTTLEKEIENYVRERENSNVDVLQELCLGIITKFNGRYAETIQEYENIELEFKALCQDARFIDVFKQMKLEIIRMMDLFMRENTIDDQILK
jgi:hypothetical protein